MSFALLSPCGFGNLGDAATMEAAIQNIRRRIPDARIQGITHQPSDTNARHGIPAFPLSRAAFKRAWNEGTPSVDEDGSQSLPQEATAGSEPLARNLALGAGTAVRAVARSILPRGWPWAIRTEIEQTAGAFRLLESVDMVLLSGGGQLDDFHGGPWLQPYALAKWALLAKLTGTRFVVLNTGFGSLDSPISRFLTRLACRLSDYRSYRDAGSKRLMKQAGFDRDDPVFPDLAFSLDVSHLISSAETTPKPRRIGISPMVYCDPERWPVGDLDLHSRYLSNLTDVAERLLASDVEVALFSSDGPDKHTVGDLEERIRRKVGDDRLDKLYGPRTDTVEEFLREAAECELVIASRLHGVILSHLVGTPVIALSYDRKVREHMNAIGQSAYCLDIDDFDPDRLSELVRTLRANLVAERASIRRKGEEFRTVLSRQWDTVLQKGLGG